MRIHQTPPPQRPHSSLPIVVGGLAGAAPCALLGASFGDVYGSQIAHSVIDTGVEWMGKGWISPQGLFRFVPDALNHANQVQAGAVLGAVVGAAAGVWLGYEWSQASE